MRTPPLLTGLGASNTIILRYDCMFSINTKIVKVERKLDLDGNNLFTQGIEEDPEPFNVELNINPVRTRVYDNDKNTVTQVQVLDVMTSPRRYPKFFGKFVNTDIIVLDEVRYKIENISDVSFNDRDLIYQQFQIHRID